MALLHRVRLGLLAVAFTALTPAAALAGASSGELPEGLAGIVKTARSPVSEARIYAYRVADPALLRVTTDADGNFLFRALPAGVYKVIAHKTGFVPAVVLLTRAARTASDFLEFELVAEQDEQYSRDDDFWSVRRKIPGDVLRDIRIAEAVPAPDNPDLTPVSRSRGTEVNAQMVSGYHGAAPGAGLRSLNSSVGVSSDLGGNQVEMQGSFRELQPGTGISSTSGDFRGSSAAIGMNVEAGERGTIRVATLQHDMSSSRVGNSASVGLERYQVSWAQPIDTRSQTSVSLAYMDESNFNRQAMVTPTYVPRSSTTVQLNGEYSRELSDRVDLRTGVIYREFIGGDFLESPDYHQATQIFDAFGLSVVRFGANLQLEYGLYSAVRGSDVSLSPQTGFVAQLGNGWSVNGVVRQRLNDLADPTLHNFAVTHFERRSNPGNEQHYYQFGVQRSLGDSEVFEIGIAHREISDTLRMMFDDDSFNQVESLYLVRGDQIPELRLALSQRLGDTVMTRFETAVGSGGGGVFRTGRKSITMSENEVRYLVASLNTQFRSTETALLLAFHHVEQSLRTLDAVQQSPIAENGMERMQFRLTQELSYFLDLDTNWAVLLDVELSRGATPFTRFADTEELRKQVAGGVAVKF